MTLDSKNGSVDQFPPPPKLAAWMSKIQHEQEHKPVRVAIVGAAGIGKTSFGASMPNPILIDWDKGAGETRVKRLPGPTTWEDALSLIRSIGRGPGPYKTLVIDTIDPLETLCESFVCRRDDRKDISTLKNGKDDYGAGYHALAAEWRVLLAELDVVRDAGLAICLLAHVIVRRVNDPTLGQYDSFAPQLQKKTAAETIRWADLFGFATFDASRIKEENRSVVTQDRVLFTSRGSGFDAKNRFSMPHKILLPPDPARGWAEVDAWIQRHRSSADTVRARILAMAKGTPYEAKASELAMAEDVGELLDTEKQLKEKLT